MKLNKPNILFIVIDALRADRCYNHEKTSKTPTINNLIKQGTYFNKTFSSSDGTPLSFSSLFTGLYPFKACKRAGKWNFKMNKDVQDFVTILRKNGYHSYATMPEMWVIEEFFSLFENKDKTYPLFGFRLYDGLGDHILKKLDSAMEEPWFYFIHLMDAHKPISFPNEFDRDEFGKDDYDKMISSVDAWLGKILEKINLENTLVVLTADHGDYLRIIERNGKRYSFEFKSYANPALKISKLTPKFLYKIKNTMFLKLRDFMTKRKIKQLGIDLTPYEKRSIFNARSYPERYLFDELFHVPLIMAGYNIRSNQIIQKQVRSVDIFPTIAKLLGITNQNQVDGIDLSPILKGEDIEEHPVYLESGFNLWDPSKAVIGIRTPKYKYFRSIKGPKQNVHLYDLENDPFEENNIAKNSSDTVEQMETLLMKLRSTSETNPPEEVQDDKEVEEQLRKLGYI